MKYNLNSLMLDFIDCGMYETAIDARHTIDSDMIDEDQKEGYIKYNAEYFWGNFDNDAYNAHCVKTLQHCYNGKWRLNDMVIRLEIGDKIFSPHEYNFSTDNVDITVTVNKAKLIEYAKKQGSKLNDFLYENYSSRSGFISFTPNNTEDLLIGLQTNDDRAVAALLNFMFANTDYADITQEIKRKDRSKYYNEFPDYESFYESFTQDFSYNNFITDEAYNRAENNPV